MNIENKEIRRELIGRYMEAETTPAEEQQLAAYYASHEADEEERPVARMIRMEHLNASLLSDEGVKEFDRIVSSAKIQPRKACEFVSLPVCELANSKPQKLKSSKALWLGGMVAAIALLLVLNLSTLRKAEPSAAFDTIEIAEHIQQMINLNMEDVTSISASPIQECVLLTATLADGTTKTFVMSKDPEEGSTSMLAIN